KLPNSVEVFPGLYAGGDFDILQQLIIAGAITESEIRFFLGYSGWVEKQLESELDSNSWIVLDNIYKDGIISKNDDSFWKEKMLELGDQYSIWSNAPENPSFN
ncbi:MAG: YqgE/AlgH family protein, partial [Draconibacterium sp.]|nr:YqgE/AlgH family protein [Draconibacterium sp.]